MKKVFLFICFLSILNACKKEPKIKIDNITQTDSGCNIIGEPALNQWQISNFDALSSRDQLIIFDNEFSFYDRLKQLEYDLNDFNLSCPVDFNYDFRVCPNPVDLNQNNGVINQHIHVDKEIIHAHFVVYNRKNESITGGGGPYALEGNYFYPNYGKNHTRYYIILTKDSCAYYGKGDIMME